MKKIIVPGLILLVLVVVFFLNSTNPAKSPPSNPTSMPTTASTATFIPSREPTSTQVLATTSSPTPLPTPTPQVETSIIFTGDVMLGRTVGVQIKRNNNDFGWPFWETKDFLSSSDITMINLENPLLDPCNDDGSEDKVFCAPTRVYSSLASMLLM